MATADVSAQQARPLRTSERWFFGSVGGLAPLLVAAATQDLEALFARITVFATLGFGVKALALAFLGGLVSYLQKTETEAWKCFIIGISAPALVTTAAVGTAKAQTKNLPYFAQQVPVMEIGEFAETSWQQFSRGLWGSDPTLLFIVLGQSRTSSEAKTASALAWLQFTCGPKVPDQQATFNPVVIKRDDGTFVSGLVTTSKGDPYSLRLKLQSVEIQDVISFSRARAQRVLSDILTETYEDLNLLGANRVYSQLNRRCVDQAIIPATKF
jgi:hypothetical protein